MPENRNFTITTPVKGTVTNQEPSTADVRNTIFKSSNVIGRKRRGYSVFGVRDRFTAQSAPSTETQYMTIGGDKITIGGDRLCYSIGETITITASAEPDIYYRDRKVQKNGNAILFSRVHDYDDFDISADMESSSRAVMFQIYESPNVSGDITAVVPYADRVCWVFTDRSLYLLTGDPVNGNLQQKSYDVGTYSQFSADVTDVGEVYFLCRDGLCSCGIEGRVNEVSEPAIPGSLLDSRNAMVAYDDLRQYVYARAYDEFWCLDERDKVFWGFDVTSLPRKRYESENGELQFVCDNNSIAQFENDKNGTCDWYVVFGPYSIAQNMRTAAVHEIQSFLSDGGCTIEVITAKTANLCLENAITFIGTDGTYTESDDFNHVHRPRKRGAWFCLVLQGTGDFEMERITVMSTMKGRLR